MKKSKNLIPHTEIVHPLITTIPVVQVHPLKREGFFQKEKVIRIQPPITLLFLYFYSQNFTSTSIHKPVNFARESENL